MLRSLDAYKNIHRKTAEDKGVLSEFLSCRTLTRARIVLYGEKRKQPGVCNCGQPKCVRYNGTSSHC